MGKTIIFAQTKKHAQFLADRFDSLYPEYKGQFCKLVVYDEPYADKNFEDFKKPNDMPFIAITVDMLETGIDVPEIVNLVFAKKVYSRIKFDQMIGRGTRLCDNLFGLGNDKSEFYIFDYMRNFQYFNEHPKGKEPGMTLSPVAEIFARKVRIIKLLQNADYEAASDWKEMSLLAAKTAIVRGVENGSNIIRHTNKGISIVSDFRGSVLAQTDYFQSDTKTLSAQVAVKGRFTLYSYIGNLFVYLCNLYLLGSFIFPKIKRLIKR